MDKIPHKTIDMKYLLLLLLPFTLSAQDNPNCSGYSKAVVNYYCWNGHGGVDTSVYYLERTELYSYVAQYTADNAITIGGIIAGGSKPNAILMDDGSGMLANYATLTFDNGTGHLTINGSQAVVMSDLATVATTGDASNLTNLAAVALDNSYNSLSDLPTISSVGHSGNYGDISGAIKFQPFSATGNGTTTFTFTVANGYTKVAVFVATPTTLTAIKAASVSGTTVTVTTTLLVANLTAITGTCILQ